MSGVILINRQQLHTCAESQNNSSPPCWCGKSVFQLTPYVLEYMSFRGLFLLQGWLKIRAHLQSLPEHVQRANVTHLYLRNRPLDGSRLVLRRA
jgi:hypothetical protein